MILTISLLCVHIDIEITCNLRRKVLYEIDWRSWVWDAMPAVLAFLRAKPRNWHYFIWSTRLIPSKDLKINEFHITLKDFKLLNSKLLSRFGDMFWHTYLQIISSKGILIEKFQEIDLDQLATLQFFD